MGSDDLPQDEIQRQLRQLALVDRILGLEAENARLAVLVGDSSGPRSGHDRLQREMAAVYASRTWRVGHAVLAPGRALRRLRNRLTRKPA